MNRRAFARTTGWGALSAAAFPLSGSSLLYGNDPAETSKVPIGLCNHALRGMKLKAKRLIDYAIGHGMDSVQFNTLSVFENLEKNHLSALRQLAESHSITIYVGAGSICESSPRFSDRYGDARALLAEGIRVANAVGSPIVGVRIGNIEDRFEGGGIEPKIEEVIRVMKSMRGPALEAGITFSFENHAGDLRSKELVDLIEETGTDICSAFYDPGNAIWAMEDPMAALEVLGRHIRCTSVRDVMVWPAEQGAAFQWTAIGGGVMDYRYFTEYLAEHCPGVPVHVETISNSPRPIPYLTAEFWKGYPNLQASGIIDFLNLVRKGEPIQTAAPPPGKDPKEFEIESQERELLKSLDYLRSECGAGIKN